ncbi:MAG: Ntn hydrolase family protein [Candidatus Dormibacteria bacterium]
MSSKAYGPPCGCSTFALCGNSLIGHNVDTAAPVPGAIMTNPRGLRKRSISWEELIRGERPGAPRLEWESRYGSLTFNIFGKEFIDGGINESGLFIQEMTLVGTEFPRSGSKPTMFMALWMQYVLDCFDTVADAVASLESVALDGWAWHFFLCDRSGHRAALEFLDGAAIARVDDQMPVPLMCNGVYADELAQLSTFAPFGGSAEIRLDDRQPVIRDGQVVDGSGVDNRFAHGALLTRESPPDAGIDHAFSILRGLERGATQWSFVIDTRRAEVAIRTSVAPAIRRFDLGLFDYSSSGPSRYVEANLGADGDISGLFADLTPTAIRKLAHDGVAFLDAAGGMTELLATLGWAPGDVEERIAGYGLDPRCQGTATVEAL